MRLFNSGHKVTIAASPSDHRADLNANAQIRRCERGDCQCRGDEVEPLNAAAPEAQVEPDSNGVPQPGHPYRIDGVDYYVSDVGDPLAALLDPHTGVEFYYDFRNRTRESKWRAAGLNGELPPDLIIEHTEQATSKWQVMLPGREPVSKGGEPEHVFDAYDGPTHVGRLTVWQQNGQWSVKNIDIELPWRRRGIGTALLNEARATLGEVGHAPPENRTEMGDGWAKHVGAATCKHCEKPATLNLNFGDESGDIPVCPKHEIYETGVRKRQTGERPKYERNPLVETDPPWKRDSE